MYVIHHNVVAIGVCSGVQYFQMCRLPDKRRNVPGAGTQFCAVAARFGADDFAIHDEVQAGLLRVVAAADPEGEERLVNSELSGDGLAYCRRVPEQGREIAVADDASHKRFALSVYEGFSSGGLFVPAVAGERPAFVVAHLEVEENRVFARRGDRRGGFLGK